MTNILFNHLQRMNNGKYNAFIQQKNILTKENFIDNNPFSKSSHFASEVRPSIGNTRVFVCYKPLSTEVDNSIKGRCNMAATMHCLAVD